MENALWGLKIEDTAPHMAPLLPLIYNVLLSALLGGLIMPERLRLTLLSSKSG
jgi:hypothetical protein